MAEFELPDLRYSSRFLLKRVEAHRAYKQFSKSLDSGGYRFAKLLGFPSYDHLMAEHDEKVQKTCEALCGPHGYAVYKILLARRKHEANKR